GGHVAPGAAHARPALRRTAAARRGRPGSGRRPAHPARRRAHRNLDSKNGQAVMKLLRELHQSGSTLIMVTHDPAYARLASRTVTLFDGRIVDETGTAPAANEA